jgi:hypothetical protein
MVKKKATTLLASIALTASCLAAALDTYGTGDATAATPPSAAVCGQVQSATTSYNCGVGGVRHRLGYSLTPSGTVEYAYGPYVVYNHYSSVPDADGGWWVRSTGWQWNGSCSPYSTCATV